MIDAGITPLVLTFNEAPNIDRTLARLQWARRVVVVDSFSTDETLAICGRYPNVDLKQRRFDNHTDQWNWGLDQITTEWVLSLDADYVLTEALIDELSSWNVLLRPVVRARRRNKNAPESEMEAVNPVLNAGLRAAVGMERVLPLKRLPGVSLVVVAHKP